jgi:hypothetical protein
MGLAFLPVLRIPRWPLGWRPENVLTLVSPPHKELTFTAILLMAKILTSILAAGKTSISVDELQGAPRLASV